MAKEPTAPSAAPETFPQTIEEFCRDLSVNDRRVEMIGAFHAIEKAAGRLKDDAAAFLARFETFVNRRA